MSEDQREYTSIGRLHVLTDFHFQQRFSHAELALLAIAGGADTIQFRQKSGALRHRLQSAMAVASVCNESNTPLIIDDEISIALAVSAAGVHLGKEDFPIQFAKRIMGSGSIIGATACTMEEAVLAETNGADYIGFGPVFETRSKANPAPTTGLKALAEACDAVQIPVVAIAGITVERVVPVFATGAYGIAVMTAITNAPDPQRATSEFREKLALCT